MQEKEKQNQTPDELFEKFKTIELALCRIFRLS